MSKHTPGEWSVVVVPPARGSGYIEIRGPNNEAIATLFPHAGYGGVGFDVARENARLMAASPTLMGLVEALTEILPLAEEYLKSAPSHPDNAKLEDARAAIAKAEALRRSGRQP